MSGPILFGCEMREFLRSDCQQGDLSIVSGDGEVTTAHAFFLLGNLPQVCSLLETCHSCHHRQGQPVTFIIPGESAVLQSAVLQSPK